MDEEFRQEIAADGVRVLRAGPAAIVELDRPQVRNAIDVPTGSRLRDEVARLGADPSVRGVLLTGTGGAFSAGADLSSFGGDLPTLPDGRPDLGHVLATVYNPLITTLRRMEKPVVAAVPGPAVGVGCSIALAADLVVASESAYFLMAFVNIGLALDGGASVMLPGRLGAARAAEMAMLGERIGAAQAHEWGLVNRVVDDASVRAEGEALVRRLAAGPTRALATIRRRLGQTTDALLAAQLAGEVEDQRAMASTQDFVEGASAFLQKRPAAFEGA